MGDAGPVIKMPPEVVYESEHYSCFSILTMVECFMLRFFITVVLYAYRHAAKRDNGAE